MIQEVLGSFQISGNLTENITREIATHQTRITFRKQALDTVGDFLSACDLFGYFDDGGRRACIVAFSAAL